MTGGLYCDSCLRAGERKKDHDCTTVFVSMGRKEWCACPLAKCRTARATNLRNRLSRRRSAAHKQ